MKVAYDQHRALFGDIAFFCATALDLAYTVVEGGRIVGSDRARLDMTLLKQFSPEAKEEYLAKYLAEGRPSKPVDEQFLATGGSREIDLRDVGAIFYVCGPSPYDFMRAGEGVIPTSTPLRRIMLSQAMDQNFFLRSQILALRAQLPHLRQYFVGSPLMFLQNPTLDSSALAVVHQKRGVIQALARDYLFDDVFMPDEAILEPHMLSTRTEFFNNGREHALDFQQDEREARKTDTYHVNGQYGLHVLKSFIEPRSRAGA